MAVRYGPGRRTGRIGGTGTGGGGGGTTGQPMGLLLAITYPT